MKKQNNSNFFFSTLVLLILVVMLIIGNLQLRSQSKKIIEVQETIVLNSQDVNSIVNYINANINRD